MRRKTKAKKRARTARRKAKTNLPKMPKPLEKRIKEMGAKPEEVVIENDVEGDPIVRVRGKTVGAWICL